MYDFEPDHDKPNPMSRKQWEAMSPMDGAKFLSLGGTLYDDIEPPKPEETITSKSGQSITRGEWDAMNEPQKFKFVMG